VGFNLLGPRARTASSTGTHLEPCGHGLTNPDSSTPRSSENTGPFGRHPGRAPLRDPAKLEARVLQHTLKRKPRDGSTHWSSRKLAAELKLPFMTVQRIWRRHNAVDSRNSTPQDGRSHVRQRQSALQGQLQWIEGPECATPQRAVRTRWLGRHEGPVPCRFRPTRHVRQAESTRQLEQRPRRAPGAPIHQRIERRSVEPGLTKERCPGRQAHRD